MKKVLSIVFALSPFVLSAHPGHGSGDGFSFGHYLSSGEHIILLIAAISMVGIAVRQLHKTRKSENF